MRELEDRYRRALAHPKIKYFTNHVPAQFRDHPHIVLSILGGALQGDPKVGDDPLIAALDAAARSLAAGRDLSRRIATAYHNSEIRAQARYPIETYLTRPDIAKRELVELSVARPDLFKKYPALDQALDAIGEAQVFHEEHGLPAPAPSAPLVKPIVEGTIHTEIEALMKKSATAKLSREEDARLDQLLAARIARDESAPPVRPDPAEERYKSLVKASLDPKGLSADQTRQLDALIEARIVSEHGNQDEGNGNGHGDERRSPDGNGGGGEEI